MHHGIRIQDAALVAAAVLSDRYVTERFPAGGQGDRPRRRGGGQDQDGGRQHAGRDRPSAAEDDAARDRGAGAPKERGGASKVRLGHLKRELAELEEQAHGMRAQWLREKEVIDKIRVRDQPKLEKLTFQAKLAGA